MRGLKAVILVGVLIAATFSASAEVVHDIPTRAGVSQRVLIHEVKNPEAAVVLFAGGHGGLQLSPDGAFSWGKNNFLIRTRNLFTDRRLLTVVIDSPSDRQSKPWLHDFRQTVDHLQDVRTVIAWLRQKFDVPVWLIGTSRGTQSVAYVASELSKADGPDGIVLTSTILSDQRMIPVPLLPLDKILIPVLVVHHEADGCDHCKFSEINSVMEKLGDAVRKQLLTFKGGHSVGDPCAGMSYHGFNGIEASVVSAISDWIIKD